MIFMEEKQEPVWGNEFYKSLLIQKWLKSK